MSTIAERDIFMLDQATAMAERAKTAETGTCTICEQKVFFLDHDVPLVAGHIYSEGGRAEFKISGSCEHCFDMAFAEADDKCRRVIGGKPLWERS